MKSLFPNLNPAAYYSPLGQFIHMNNFTNKTFDDLDNAYTDYQTAKKFSIYMHEYQHWLDHHATLWGINNLLLVYNAFSAKASGNEYNFHHIRKLSLEFKKEEFKDYYSETINDIKGSFRNRWKFEYTTGIRYNQDGYVDENKPLLFIKFSTLKNEPVSRVPVSILTLLETKAMCIENAIRLDYLNHIPKEIKLIDSRLFNAEVESWLYNPEYCVYNSAAHIISTQFKLTDTAFAFEISALFASLALNFPRSLTSKMKIPEGIEAWGKRPVEMLKNHDLGFIFWCLVNNAGRSVNVENISLKTVLEASGIELDFFIQEVFHELNSLKEKILPGYFAGKANGSIEWCKSYINQFGLHCQIDIPFFKSDLLHDNAPNYTFSDTNFAFADLKTSENIVELIRRGVKIDFEMYYALVHFYEEKFQEFDKICGV